MAFVLVEGVPSPPVAMVSFEKSGGQLQIRTITTYHLTVQYFPGRKSIEFVIR
jgi:hypothetical protein